MIKLNGKWKPLVQFDMAHLAIIVNKIRVN